MREVTSEEFYATVGHLDVHPNAYPMESLWKLRSGQVIGKSTPGYLSRDENGRYTEQSRYWVDERLTAGQPAA